MQVSRFGINRSRGGGHARGEASQPFLQLAGLTRYAFQLFAMVTFLLFLLFALLSLLLLLFFLFARDRIFRLSSCLSFTSQFFPRCSFTRFLLEFVGLYLLLFVFGKRRGVDRAGHRLKWRLGICVRPRHDWRICI